MDTATPGSDLDLGTPNDTFGGPGWGEGGESGEPGENAVYLKNALFIQEKAKQKVDDASKGGHIKFDFYELQDKITITEIALLDIDVPSETGTKVKVTTDTHQTNVDFVDGLGDNSLTMTPLTDAGEPMKYLKVEFIASGAIPYMKGCVRNMECHPFTQEACVQAALALGLSAGPGTCGGFPFAGAYTTPGCYSYTSGSFLGCAYYGTGAVDGVDPGPVLRSGQFRIPGFDCN